MIKKLSLFAVVLGISVITAMPATVKAASENLNINSADEVTANKKENNNIKIGFQQNSDGTWSLYDAKGFQVKSSWCEVGGKWYYIKDDGIMATSWIKDNGHWYCLDESGNMRTGWVFDHGNWYYLNEDGIMQRNTTVDGYELGPEGAWVG